MYPVLLAFHSWARWAVLIAAIAVLIRSAIQLARGGAWTDADRKLGLVNMILFDLQLLAGLGLYFGLSPVVAAARNTPGWMKNPELRFWMVEHISMMLLAIIAVHVGKVIAKRAATDRKRYAATLVSIVLAFLLVGAAIPWPGSAHARPLFRQILP